MSDVEIGPDAESEVGSVPPEEKNVGDDSSLLAAATAGMFGAAMGLFGSSGEQYEQTGRPIRVESSIWYRDASSGRHDRHKLDIYIPEEEEEDEEHSVKGRDFYEEGKKKAGPTTALGKQQQKQKSVIIFIHGGEWRKGDRSLGNGMYQNVGEALADHNFVVCVISYRLTKWNWLQVCLLAAIFALIAGIIPSNTAPPHVCAFVSFLVFLVFVGLIGAWHKPYAPVRHPMHVRDVVDAIQWVILHIGEFGGDASRIFLVGHDSGAHLAALVATDHKYLHEVGIEPAFIKSCLRGVVSISGYLDHDLMRSSLYHTYMTFPFVFGSRKAEDWSDAFPISHVGKHCPPFLLLNAKNEHENLTEHSKSFLDRLERHHVPCEHHIIDHTDHLSIVRSIGTGPDWDQVTPMILKFIQPLNGIK